MNEKKLLTDFIKSLEFGKNLIDILEFRLKSYDDLFGLKNEHIFIKALFKSESEIGTEEEEEKTFLISRHLFLKWSYKKVHNQEGIILLS